jgi:hypothetical protein
MLWETLRPFFESRGYVLFKAGGLDGELNVPQPTKNGYSSPAAESFGLYGDRETFRSTFCLVSSCCNHIHGARFDLFPRNPQYLQLETGIPMIIICVTIALMHHCLATTATLQ